MTVSDLRQLLTANAPNVVFLSETKLHANEFERTRIACKIEGCYVVS